jgi:UDP-N-acetylglucosamine--N-acetylmuramyl-(pentapeptide) pyrophosphoryl-undecaprenol N-acetylglucosamine transferase
MSAGGSPPLVLLAAGGTGGHLFPAEALAVALKARGLEVDLATDERATRYGMTFPARATHVVASDTFRARDPVAVAKTLWRLGGGVLQALGLIGRLRPAAVVGFGGYPSIPPLVAAWLRGVPTVIHEQNGVMGRANRLLARRVTAIATGFPDVLAGDPALAAKATHTGNPLRPPVIAAAAIPYTSPESAGGLNLLVFGGSQGARVMSEVVPPAIELLEASLRARISIVQQAREEDIGRVREIYARARVSADVAPFFTDLPARMAAAHLVIARAGASTVSELAAIGRPSILVPLPGALDQDQLANANRLAAAGGAIVHQQDLFTPRHLADELAVLAAAPHRLVEMAASARSLGAPDAAERLADLVVRTAGLQTAGSGP